MSSHDSLLQSKGFLASLFDFSFTSFVTLRFIKIIYIVTVVLSGLWGLVVLLSQASRGGGYILLGLLFGAIAFFISVIVYRVLLEFVVAIFRIAENTSITARNSNRPSEQ